ncbi:MAG: hypothetical protein EOO41_00340 [Methanobacteriota archaeon]|nr:MAG: hypothetical protein EOO41_00340 [Euryarchaeota archaeon]
MNQAEPVRGTHLLICSSSCLYSESIVSSCAVLHAILIAFLRAFHAHSHALPLSADASTAWKPASAASASVSATAARTGTHGDARTGGARAMRSGGGTHSFRGRCCDRA